MSETADNIIFEEISVQPARAHRRRVLPEKYGPAWRHALIAADMATTLAVTLVVLPAELRVGALLFTALTLALMAVCGLYRRSYAVNARDEVYAVLAAFAAILLPGLALLAAIGTPLGRAFAAIVVAAGALATVRALLTATRRAESDPPLARVEFIDAAAIERVNSPSFLVAVRIFDVTIAAIALAVFAIPMAVISALVFLDSGKPVIFRQRRAGRANEPFDILKFRTMRADADSQWARPDDHRVTPIGAFLRRTSLDELPQVFNVLRGDMSIVGPRPEMVDFAQTFDRNLPHYAQRHFVKPGITGWAQIYLHRNLEPSDVPDVLQYDLFYVQHAGIFLNAVILLKTAAEVMFHCGV